MSFFSKLIDFDRDNEQNWAYQSWTNTLLHKKSVLPMHRIISELTFAKELSKLKNNQFNPLLESVSEELFKKIQKQGGLLIEDVIHAEAQLSSLKDVAKQYELLFAAHAHIDINWLWGFHETVNVAIDTFRTMLDLMNENPEFIFSQSQAFLYQIIEEYHPKMFEEIKSRVLEGRWEVTASTWVEGDKNMANGESQARQLLYAKDYLSKSLGIDSKEIVIDFEPDTFGHVITLPEILQNGGTKYFYHSRGSKDLTAYVFESPSGKSVIGYRDPKSYMMGISGKFAKSVVTFSEKTGLKKILAVYGVCDHGGGPTRKDLFMIEEMKSWPIYPSVRYSTYRNYFEYLEQNRKLLPIVKDELNFVFTGCYTSQSRIKMANRIGENAMYDSEFLSTMANQKFNTLYNSEKHKQAWLNILTSQFHDILPGSGLQFTREYALGKFQDTIAFALSQKKIAMETFANEMDTSKFAVHQSDSFDTSFGAGVGFHSEAFQISKTSRGSGDTRVYHVFNSLAYAREEYIEVFVWNYESDITKIKFQDAQGNDRPFVLTPNPTILFDGNMKNDKQASYWGHWYNTFRVLVEVPAFGYSTLVMMQDPLLENHFNNYLVQEDNIPRVELEHSFVLENEFVKATFDSNHLLLASFVEKSTGQELVSVQGAGLHYIIEDTTPGMDAWIVGREVSSNPLTETSNVHIEIGKEFSFLSYVAKKNESIVKVRISLASNEKRLRYFVNTEWREIGKYNREVPKLSYVFSTSKSAQKFKYDVPFGVIERDPSSQDHPGLSFISGQYDGYNLFLATDSKYGFRGSNETIGVSLIRSSTNPDKYPEVGDHSFQFEIGPIDDFKNSNLIQWASIFNHPLDTLMGSVHKGNASLQASFIQCTNKNIIISSVKRAEYGGGIFVRFYEVNGMSEDVSIKLPFVIAHANVCDSLENVQEKLHFEGKTVHTHITPYSVVNILVRS